MELGEPITSIKGIGPRRAEALGKLGLFSLRDLLYFAPREYQDFSAATPICAAAHGALAALHVLLVSEPKHVHIRRGMEITTVRALGFGTDPADKAAIDYFIKYAGCDNDGNQLPDSPMKGGIVIFAAGNDNVSNPGTASPADYDAVVSVAAIAPDYTKASYSNYGSYIDISAPGGNLNGNGMVYSTIHNSSYGDMSGTSMACPMVSGVAALVIQKYGLNERGFTPDRLKEILFKSAYDVDNYNPKYAGQLGYGCVDATAALGIEVTDEMPTLTLKNSKVSDGNLLFWVNYQLAGNARIIIYNSTGGKVFDSKRGVMAMSITTIDVSKLAAGYYTMEYQCNGRTMKQNFIKY